MYSIVYNMKDRKCQIINNCVRNCCGVSDAKGNISCELIVMLLIDGTGKITGGVPERRHVQHIH